MMANHHTRGLFVALFSLSQQLSPSQSDIKLHWSVNIYQQIKTEEEILSPRERIAPSAERVFERQSV